MQTLNLTIDCLDRPGLLAEIAQIIAGHGHNIKVCTLPSLLFFAILPILVLLQVLPATVVAGPETSLFCEHGSAVLKQRGGDAAKILYVARLYLRYVVFLCRRIAARGTLALASSRCSISWRATRSERLLCAKQSAACHLSSPGPLAVPSLSVRDLSRPSSRDCKLLRLCVA